MNKKSAEGKDEERLKTTQEHLDSSGTCGENPFTEKPSDLGSSTHPHH